MYVGAESEISNIIYINLMPHISRLLLYDSLQVSPDFNAALKVTRRSQWPLSLRLEHWNCGFESHSRHGCLSAFALCLCCSVYS
jgi:hypothetical protein